MIINQASGLLDTAFGKVQTPVKQYLTDREEVWQKKSMIDLLFSMEVSTNFAETYASETAFGDFEPTGENGLYTNTDFQESYSKIIQDEEWKSRFAITLRMIEDAKMGKIKSKGEAFVRSYYRTREKFAAAMFSNGVSTSMTFGTNNKTFNIACADGKALFATDHPSITGKTSAQSNLFNVELTYDNLTKVETRMQNFKDDNGNILGVEPDTIIIPNNPVIKQTLFEILNADGNPTTADRAGNYHLGRWNVVVWPYLTDPTGLTSGKDWWMMMDADYNDVNSAIVWQDRIELSTKSYVNEDTDENIWKGRARFTAAPVDWRVIAGCIPGLGTTL